MTLMLLVFIFKVRFEFYHDVLHKHKCPKDSYFIMNFTGLLFLEGRGAYYCIYGTPIVQITLHTVFKILESFYFYRIVHITWILCYWVF